MDIGNTVRNLIEKPLEEEGILLEEIVYEKEGSNYFLRIIINKNDLDECIRATKIIDPILDQNNVIEDAYILDICSKGGL